MKTTLITLTLLILIGCSKPPPEPIVIIKEVPVPKPEPPKTTQDAPEQPLPEPTIGERTVAVVQFQRNLTMPDTLPDGSAVLRVEPDGIHVRTKSGIKKLSGSQIDEATREKYHIYPDTASEYARIMRERRTVASQAHKQYISNQEEAHRREQEAEALAKEEAKQAQDSVDAARQWAEYDRQYQAYLIKLKHAQDRDARTGTVKRMPRQPVAPSVPRP